MRIIATIEARMNSSRLPGKVLMKVKKKTFLEILINRLKKIKILDEIVLCTTKNTIDNKLIDAAKASKIQYYRGSENNVLGRVFSAAKKFKANVIIQITADCPIIDYKLILKALLIYKKKKYDCVSNCFIRSFPDGMDVNIISYNALKKSFLSAKKKKYKEHVSMFIKENPKKFKIKNIIASKKNYWPQLGVTLDEYKDYLLLKKIINYFDKKKNFFDCADIINIVKKKKWIKINEYVKRKGYDKKYLL
jgi:spore coat polysaccharide biosynthesis protein SpsF